LANFGFFYRILKIYNLYINLTSFDFYLGHAREGTVLRRKTSTVTDKFVCFLIFISKTLRIAHLTLPGNLFWKSNLKFLKLAAVYTYYLLFPKAILRTLL
jgi:hypothetical protein